MELRRYQNQAAEYNRQISELRRQVTNERFDRARKDEESRRYFVAGGRFAFESLSLVACFSFSFLLRVSPIATV